MSTTAGLDPERLIWMFTQMLRIREFEERVKRTFEEHPGVIRGHTHLADGAEASIVGSLATMLWLLILRRKGLDISTLDYFKLGLTVVPVMLAAESAIEFPIS